MNVGIECLECGGELEARKDAATGDDFFYCCECDISYSAEDLVLDNDDLDDGDYFEEDESDDDIA